MQSREKTWAPRLHLRSDEIERAVRHRGGSAHRVEVAPKLELEPFRADVLLGFA
jgi:hypothetical protein